MKKLVIYIFLNCLLSNHIYIDLITTNDIHGVINEQTAYFMNPEFPPNIVGGAAFYKYVKELKKDNADNLLILDASNFYQGSNFGMNDKGESMIEWMNMIEYDAFVPGQYDFIFGHENLNSIIDNAKFPMLASNLNCNECFNNIKPYIIKNINGVSNVVVNQKQGYSLNFLVQSNDVISNLSGHLSKENFEVFALSHSRPSLDDVYLQATGKTLMDAELELAGKRDFKLENKKSMR